ncbi:hypothetical protein BY458DRAFT_475619 [Sporodiniella umbellata]|nr:hypothetical protein BY458DRAFT_475619 [Sporodiniella umbellata]
MSKINFSTHGKDIQAAYDSVIKGTQNWLIYAFDKGTYDLRVQATGDDGLEGLADEFSDGKVQFAFTQVKDPNTELPKFVFIAWCGSGVPELRKAFFNSQLDEVSKFFKSFHVQINARDEADVDPELIMKRVSESSGANYSVHKETSKPQPRVTPVGSVYKKTEIPDIASMQRQSMTRENMPAPVGTSYKPVVTTPRKLENRWNASQENSTSGADSVRAEREAFEKQVREREMQKHQEQLRGDREDQAKEEARRKEEQKAREEEDRVRREREAQEAEARRQEEAQYRREDEAHRKYLEEKERKRLEEERRLQEAQIGNDDRERKEDQRKQQEEEAYRKQQEEEAYRRQQEETHRIQQEDAQRQREEAHRRQQEEARQRQQEEEAQRKQQEETQRRQQEEAQRKQREEDQRRQQEEASRLEEERQQKEQIALQSQLSQTADRAVHASQAAGATSVLPNGSKGVSAVVLFAYDASEANEMSLEEGEIVHEIDQVDEGWWFGVSENGKKEGLFPANYVEVLEEAAPQAQEEVHRISRSVPPPPAPTQQPEVNAGKAAVALYDYEAGEDNEISFREGDTITQIEFLSEDWWQGLAPNKKDIGLFPANYVELK